MKGVSIMNRPILASIHIEAFRHNLARVRALAPEAKIWSVVKAAAYGHRLESILEGLSQTDGFALLDLRDARWLRNQGWQGRILLLEGLFEPEELAEAVSLDCDLVVHCQEQVVLLERLAQHSSHAFQVFLKLNSGMNRLGFSPTTYRDMYHRLHALGHQVNHMTHFANADAIDQKPTVGEQMDCFTTATDGLAGETCLANSAAILWHRTALGDWVRPGIMLYGLSPTGIHADIEHAHLQPVMSLTSEIIDIQHLAAGEHVGYGGRFTAPEAMRIGVIACGYADGYPRHAPDGTPVWVESGSAGAICPIAGRVSMDMITIDLRNAPDAQIGSKVELWGQKVPADTVAAAAGTIGYELICALAPRVPVELIRKS
jgi:alanine racemase